MFGPKCHEFYASTNIWSIFSLMSLLISLQRLQNSLVLFLIQISQLTFFCILLQIKTVEPDEPDHNIVTCCVQCWPYQSVKGFETWSPSFVIYLADFGLPSSLYVPESQFLLDISISTYLHAINWRLEESGFLVKFNFKVSLHSLPYIRKSQSGLA